jgi:hypothetical protein
MEPDKQITYKRNIGAGCTTKVTVEKQYVLHILSVCVCV